MQDIIKNDESKHGKHINLVNIHHPLFLRDIHEGHLSIEKADKTQSNFANELKNFDKGINTLGKKVLNNLGLLFSAREKLLHSFKNSLFPIKNLDKTSTLEPATEPAREPRKAAKAKIKRKNCVKNFYIKPKLKEKI